MGESRDAIGPRIMSWGFFSIRNAQDLVGLAAVAAAIGLAGCQQTATPTPVPNAVTGQNPGDIKYYPSDEPVRLGMQRFYEGNFGLAQQYFQDAVEKAPKDATAWVAWRQAPIVWGGSISPTVATPPRSSSSA